jgi:hypothetical protein
VKDLGPCTKDYYRGTYAHDDVYNFVCLFVCTCHNDEFLWFYFLGFGEYHAGQRLALHSMMFFIL